MLQPGSGTTDLLAGVFYNRAVAGLGWVFAQARSGKSHDYGDNAEPDESGAKYLFFTPGVSYALTKSLQIYGFVQLPVYQYVTGVQLTSHWAALAGASWRFRYRTLAFDSSERMAACNR